MQVYWGNFISFLYGNNKRNNFKWQLDNYDNIINNNKYKKLIDSFNNLAHYYHTIGNIAPCAKGINSPKGFGSNCFDRLDLFFERELISWIKYYINEDIIINKSNVSEISKILHLDIFLNDNLDKDVVLLNKDSSIKDIEKLSNYIDDIVKLIKKRSNMLKKHLLPI